MKFSIVTVCYNAQTHIESCLRSVAEQTHADIQHIVIDGASTDQTLQLVRSYPHLAEIVSGPDGGIYDAMNKGIALSDGDFILFLNADDKFATVDALEKTSSLIARDSAADVYYGALEVCPLDGEPYTYRPPSAEEAAELMIGGCLPHQSTCARPSVFKKTGLFDTQYRYHADYDWYLKILADPTIVVHALPCTIGSFREGGTSSQLAQAQPEVYEIQNKSPLYAGEEWTKRRVRVLQKLLLDERIENARLRDRIRLSAPTGESIRLNRAGRSGVASFRNSLARMLPRRVAEALKRARAALRQRDIGKR